METLSEKENILMNKFLKIVKKEFFEPKIIMINGGKIGIHKGDFFHFSKVRFDAAMNMLKLIEKMDRKKPKKGDLVLIRDDEDEDWSERVFFAEVDGLFYCNTETWDMEISGAENITGWKKLKTIKKQKK